jgi:hypothetical protein
MVGFEQNPLKARAAKGRGEFEAERELDAPRGDNLPRIGKEAK